MPRLAKTLVIVTLISGSISSAVAADSDIQNLLQGVEEKAVEIQVLKDALSGEDSNVRHVLFNRIVKLDRPDLVDLAIHTALDSDDKVLRSMALWQIIERRSEIVLNFGPQERYEDQAKWNKHTNEWGGKYSLGLQEKHPKKRCANTYRGSGDGCRSDNSVTVSGEILSFVHNHYSGTLTMNAEGTAMVGAIDIRDEQAYVFWPLR